MTMVVAPPRRMSQPLALVTGLAVGALTLGLQALPTPDVRAVEAVLATLNNSGAAWSFAAFVACAVLPVRGWAAALAGTLVLLGADLGYYACTTLFLHDDVSGAALKGPLAWGVVALVAGPLFGAAGATWRRGEPWWRPVALGLLGGIFVAQALYDLVVLRYVPEAVVSVAFGVGAVLLLGRTWSERGRASVATIAWTVLMCVALGGVVLVTDAIFLGR
ncbi:DUF6518 family protein [Virgisporangium aliadipatigenens]|nr:DUF6518 family protein [Virgisporangium aliadipatigenens]